MTIPTTQKLETLDHPGLEGYKIMRRPAIHRDAGYFVAEGEKTVRRLLQSKLRVRNLLVPEKWLEEYRPLISKRLEAGEKMDIFTADKKLLESLTGLSFYQGVLAMADIPENICLGSFLEKKQKSLSLVMVEDVTNTGNMGMIARNCAGLGADLLITGPRCCSPYIRGAVNASMGTIFDLPHHQSGNLLQTLESLKVAGVRLIAAHPREGSRPLDKSLLRGDVCVVFGSEGPGLSDEVAGFCDEAVEIPMMPGVDSLNVANAAAVFLYEIHRQRQNIQSA